MVSIQYNAALAITVALRGSSMEKLYQELGLKTLQRRWYRKLRCFYKILKKYLSPRITFIQLFPYTVCYREQDNVIKFHQLM